MRAMATTWRTLGIGLEFATSWGQRLNWAETGPGQYHGRLESQEADKRWGECKCKADCTCSITWVWLYQTEPEHGRQELGHVAEAECFPRHARCGALGHKQQGAQRSCCQRLKLHMRRNAQGATSLLRQSVRQGEALAVPPNLTMQNRHELSPIGAIYI